jgi:oxygen-independent coproporphyrinogen-3 oxidase
VVADVEHFCSSIEACGSAWGEEEELDRETRFRETVIMGLRMLKGVSLSGLEQRFSINALEYYGTVLMRLQQQQLIEMEDDRLFLSAQGLLLANRVMAELV